MKFYKNHTQKWKKKTPSISFYIDNQEFGAYYRILLYSVPADTFLKVEVADSKLDLFFI